MPDISKRHAVTLISGAFSMFLLLCIFTLIGFAAGTERAIGTWAYIAGFMLIGHGIKIGVLKINLLIIGAIIGTTFGLWHILKHSIEYVRKESMNTSYATLLWLTIFIVIIIGFHVVGYALMFFGEYYLLADMEVIEPFTEVYESIDILIDIFLAIPLYFIAMLYFWQYVWDDTNGDG